MILTNRSIHIKTESVKALPIGFSFKQILTGLSSVTFSAERRRQKSSSCDTEKRLKIISLIEF